MDEATRRLTASAIAFSDAGMHTLKGKSEPAQLWRAIRVVSGLAGSQRLFGSRRRCAAVIPNFGHSKSCSTDASTMTRPRLVLVNGPAGVGKSRLGWELEKYVDGLAAKVLWYRGRCSSYGDGVAFSALAEMVRQRFGVAEEDHDGESLGQA